MTLARDTAANSLPLAAQSKSDLTQNTALLKMQGIVKRYGVTTALNGVDLEVKTGEIHALLGENGAGKSTLMHVLSGLTQPDAGTISLNGSTVRISSPSVARQNGIAMVHQHFTLVPAFTVAENLALDSDTRFARGKAYRPLQAAEQALKRAATLGWQLDATVQVSDLSVGTQQRVEIVKALATEARLLIFDEPTAVLSPEEVEELFNVLRLLRDEGNAVILIAHKLAEIMAVADRVTVLRRGNLVATCRVAETNTDQLAAWMVGSDLKGNQEKRADVQESATPRSENPVLLSVSNIVVAGDRGEKALKGLSLDVRQGEIFGIGGVDGNGQTELAETLVGLRKVLSGTLTWCGRDFLPGSRPKVGYIPQDRQHHGLAVTLSIRENLLFDAVQEPAFRRGPFLKRRALREHADQLVQRFDIRTSDASLPASSLSGGNQQKIVVARAFRSEPELIVAMNPSRGLDVGATQFVHEQLCKARERGAAVVLISTDLDEIEALSDRAAILSAGTLTAYDMSEGGASLGRLLGGLSAQSDGSAAS